MPVFQLIEKPVFPPVEWSEKNGLLALGGDLEPSRLIAAYSQGIFPWFGEDEPILWWSPDPRLLLFPDKLHVSRTMGQILKQEIFRVTFDVSFREVITACRESRLQGPGTWITPEMVEAFCRLHDEGFAHSVEVWQGDELAGGLYGVSLGACFCGESMFSRVKNASKVALISLTHALQARDFLFIDCQNDSDHLRRLGAELVPRTSFIQVLHSALQEETRSGSWAKWAPPGNF